MKREIAGYKSNAAVEPRADVQRYFPRSSLSRMHRQINQLIHRSALALIIHADNHSIETLQRSKCQRLMRFNEPFPKIAHR